VKILSYTTKCRNRSKAAPVAVASRGLVATEGLISLHRYFVKKRILAGVFLISSSFFSTSYADETQDFSYSSIAARLAPSGVVNEIGKEKIVPQQNKDAATPDRSGKEIFDEVCSTCHEAGIAGAPRFNCKSDWTPRLQKGMKTLLTHALHGFNFMPEKGTCDACSAGEIEEAVRYMTDHSQNEKGCG